VIVGVLPASFSFPERDVDIWFPVPPDSPEAQNREATWYRVVGRLKPGVSVAQAQANLAAVQAQLGRAYPKSDGDLTVTVQPLKDATVGEARNSLWLLFGAVSLLLLIACTNIVALLLARAAQRQHEIAVRFSLGAPRRVLVMQLLTEVFVLALAGAGLGLLLAGAASKIFGALAANLPRVGEIGVDWRIVAYSLVCSVVTTLACGLLPAIRGTQKGSAELLAQAGRTQVSGRNRLQWLMVGVQVALAVTLLSGAGLLVRSFQELGRVSPGFQMDHILTFHVSASWGETADMPGLSQRIERMLEGLRNVPGAEEAATSASIPGVPGKYETELKILEGEQDPNRKILAESRFVSPSYFATMRIPLLSGEICRDDYKAIQAMVNRSFANAYLHGGDGAGDHVEFVGSNFIKGGELRGVVGDAREMGLNHEPVPTVYWCLAAPEPDPNYLVRTAGDPMAMARTLRGKIHEMEPGRSVFEMAPLTDDLDDAFAENRMRTVLLALFALTAVALACVGLYGTLSYSVNVRRREVGLRLALGAVRGQIVKQFLALGLGVAAIGCAVGWGLAAMFGHVLVGMLYGVSPTDVATLVGVTVLVLIVATVASLVPAMRASRVEPMQVLREE
jgi:putative ABC transport system permease protein